MRAFRLVFWALPFALIPAGLTVPDPARAQPAPTNLPNDEVASQRRHVEQLHQARKFDEVVPAAEKLAALAVSRNGEGHASHANALTFLGLAYKELGRGKEAESSLQRALAIYEKQSGPEHNNVVIALGNLASAYSAQGRPAEAEPLQKRALAIREKALGSDHKDLAPLLINLASLYQAQGRYGEAEQHYTRAIAVREKALGPDHKDLGPPLVSLSGVYHSQGRYGEAEAPAKRALAIYEREFGPDHGAVAAALTALAAPHQAQGRYAEAEPLMKRALAIYEKVSGPEHTNVATSLAHLSSLYQNQARYAEAEALQKRVIAIREKALGPDHRDLATALIGLASLNQSQGRYAEAEPLYRRALAIYERTLGPEHPFVASALNSVGSVLHVQGRYAEAEVVHKRSLAIREKALGPDHPHVANALGHLAVLYFVQGRYAEAEPFYKRSLAIREKALGPEHQETGASYTSLGALYQAQGRYADAEAVHKRALAVREKALGPDHPNVAMALVHLASLYHTQGRHNDAEPLYKRALAIQEKALGPNHRDVGTALNSLAGVYRTQGRYGEAEPLMKRALSVIEGALGPDNPEVASALAALASLYRLQARYAETEPLYKRAISIYEKAMGPNHRYIGRWLTDLSGIYRMQRRPADAESALKRALSIYEKALAPDHSDVASPLNALCRLYQDQNRYVEAAPLCERSIAIYEKALGPNHPNVAAPLGNLANLYRLQARFAEAEPLHKRALDIYEKSLGPEHPWVATSLAQLAHFYFVQNQWTPAIEYARRGTDLVIRRATRGVDESAQGLSGNVRSEVELASDRFRILIKAIDRIAAETPEQAPRFARETFLSAQWARTSEAAASLAQMAARAAKGDGALGGLVRERQDLLGEWQGKDKLLITARSESPEERNNAAETVMNRRLAAIDARIVQIDKVLAKDFPEYAALASPKPLTVENVQAHLRADEAMVLFLDTSEIKPVPAETYVWVVTKTDVRWVRSELGTRALNDRVAALRCGLDRAAWEGASRCPALLKQAYTEADVVAGKLPPFDLSIAETLYRALFGQVEDLIEGKQLLIVPSGPLTALPFQVLVTKAPGVAMPADWNGPVEAAWLAKRHAITVLPSAASLAALREFAQASKATRPFIGFGNPLLVGPYGSDKRAWQRQNCRDLSPAPVQIASRGVRGVMQAFFRGGLANVEEVRAQYPLPETADELCAVARSAGSADSDVYLGENATEKTIKALSANGTLSQMRVVHFATHGLLAGETEMLSGSKAEPALILTPPAQPTEEDDGLLTASEVAQLKLDAEWVVLSACNTAAGSGNRPGAESLSGLARAFFYAGARALLVSHWAVDSEATVKLITRAFDEIKADPKIGRAEALRRSMLTLIDTGTRHAHPAFWAPFVVVGEGAR